MASNCSDMRASTVLLSADGQTVALTSGQGAGPTFRWTKATGRTTPCGNLECQFSLMSGDGNLLIGVIAPDYHDIVWDQKHGVRDLRSVLVAAGVDFTKWTGLQFTAMTRDKRVFIGNAYDGQGNMSAFRLVLPDATLD